MAYQADEGAGSRYRIDHDGTVVRLLNGITVPSDPAFTRESVHRSSARPWAIAPSGRSGSSTAKSLSSTFGRFAGPDGRRACRPHPLPRDLTLRSEATTLRVPHGHELPQGSSDVTPATQRKGQ